MNRWTVIVSRWPERGFEIWRRCATDPDLRSIVCQYQEARSALDRWRAIDVPSSRRIADYEDLVRDLEAEIESALSQP
jgi:hypothetical protein